MKQKKYLSLQRKLSKVKNLFTIEMAILHIVIDKLLDSILPCFPIPEYLYVNLYPYSDNSDISKVSTLSEM